MELIPLKQISVSYRQRKFFPLDKIIELAEDIRHNGLLHAPVLQADSLDLLAGERRCRAVEMIYDTGGQFMYGGELIPPGLIPITRAHSRDAIGWMEAELSENLARQDLTWQERAQALLHLDDLRKLQNPGHTEADTLTEVRAACGDNPPGLPVLREEILLAKHLEDEDVAKQKTRSDAMRVLRRKAQLQRATALGQQFDLSAKTQSPHTPVNSDCREWLSFQPSGTFDLILTDPPYGIDAQDHNEQNILGHQYDDSYPSWRELMLWFAGESYRLAASDSHLYLMCDIERWYELRGLFTAAGWRVWRRPMIWNKGNGMLPRPDYGPRNTYEAILFATKGEKKIKVVGGADIITCPQPALNRTHGAEKPVGLFLELMKRSCLPGETVLDPFMGAGTIFPAANLARLRATGIEVHPAFFGVAVTRLEGTQ
jgi:site-specific DNA-methyltransferase (adenine-specific)